MTPMLETDDLRQTIAFYTDLLGFEILGIYPDEENPVWTSFGRDDVRVMFTVRNAHSTVAKPTMTGSLYFRPDNVDEVWELVRERATVEYPIENFEYGMREFAIYDNNGYLLQFGQEIE